MKSLLSFQDAPCFEQLVLAAPSGWVRLVLHYVWYEMGIGPTMTWGMYKGGIGIHIGIISQRIYYESE